MSDFIHSGYMDRATHKKLQSMGLFKPNEVYKKIGVSQPTLSRWIKKKLIKHVSRGLYIHPQSPFVPEYMDFAIACSHFGFKSAWRTIRSLLLWTY